MDGAPFYLGWFDDTHVPAENKIAAAAARYVQRHGEAPNICLVHAAEEVPATVAGLTVYVGPHVHRHHFLVGRVGEPGAAGDQATAPGAAQAPEEV